MSTSRRLEMKDFERLLDIHGGRAERWPEAVREPLARLLESNEVARARWEDARSLDALLAALPDVEPAPALMARIAALPARHPRPARAAWWPFQGSFAPLFAWGAAAVLGVVVGMVQAPDLDLDSSDTDVGAEVSDDLAWVDEGATDDWTEMDGLVTGDDWAAEDD